jgi:CelD/BcsL family acetyltransferase involved in cellulose biosynthesis
VVEGAVVNALVFSREPLASASASPLSRHVLTDAASLEALRPEWEELLRDSGADEVTLAPDWMLTWHGVFGGLDGRRLCAVAWRDGGGRLVGLAPLLRRRVCYRGLVPFRRLELLGAGEPEADSICTEYLNVPARRGLERTIADALAQALTDRVVGSWDELVVPRLAGDQPMTALLVEALGRAGLTTTLETTGEAPYVPLPSTWDGYLKALPGEDRYFVKRTLRELETWGGASVRLQVARTAEELEQGKRLLIDLHRDRWNEVGPEAGTFRSERFLAFHGALWPRLLARGELELAWLNVGEKPIAAICNFIRGGKVSFYQCGRAADVPPKVRPGIALLLMVLRGHIEAGRREFDFLDGAVRYKRQLATATRPVVQLRAVRPCWRERLRRLVEWGVERLRPLRGMLRRRSPLRVQGPP